MGDGVLIWKTEVRITTGQVEQKFSRISKYAYRLSKYLTIPKKTEFE